jgi:hypothetical protein
MKRAQPLERLAPFVAADASKFEQNFSAPPAMQDARRAAKADAVDPLDPIESREGSDMKRKRLRHASFLIPLGRQAVFYVPAEKMDDPQFGLDGSTPTEMFDRFFIQNFGGLTHEESQIRGEWASGDGQKVFTDQHQRYEVSFAGKKKEHEFLNFLSEMCGRLGEESIYVTMATRSWLVKPKKSLSTDRASSDE